MRNHTILLILLILQFALAVQGFGAVAGNVGDVLGTWEGESKCTIANSPCHDEHVIYDIVKVANSDELMVTADKVVNGQRETMGSLSCLLEESTLKCTYKSSHWDFLVNGRQMNGTLKLADGTLYRRVSLTRKE